MFAPGKGQQSAKSSPDEQCLRCLKTKGDFLKEEEWLNLEEEGSRSSSDSKGSPGDKDSCPCALPHIAEFILRENKASLGDTLVQRDTLNDMYKDLPNTLLFCVSCFTF